MAVQFALPSALALDSNGTPIVGARFYFKVPSTDTAKDVYSDAGLTTPVEQPVETDAAGRLPRLYMGSGTYKVVFCEPDDSVINTWDNYDPGLPQGFGTSDVIPVNLGGTGANNAPLALQNLNAASQDQITDIQSDISTLQGQVAALGDLAALDTINDAALIDTAVKQAINPFGLQLGHYRDVQTSGTAGATYSSGAWRTVRLNTAVTTEISGISLSSNQLTSVPAGTYYVRAISPFTSTSGATDFVAQGRIQNITDTSTILLGINTGNGGSGETLKYGHVFVEGRFTLAATKTIEFQFQGTTACTGGKPGSFGSEIYANIFLWKVA